MSNPVLAMFAGQPTLLAPEQREQFVASIAGFMRNERAQEMLSETASAGDDFWPSSDSWKAQYRPYVVVDGVLHIPVRGVLLHNFPWADGPWATGYDYIWRAFERGMHDGNVRAIALITNSPGGMVAGCFDAVDRMVALKGEVGKPVWSFAHESMYSAAYAIGSVGDKIAMSRTGGVGSIGVVTTHVDLSAALEKWGEKVTFIYAGKHKVDGNSAQPLPDDVKDRIQARIDELYDVFVSSVARNRGMDEQAVRDTEALTFSAKEALSNGLADSIGALDDSLAAFSASLNSDSGDESMADISQADLDAAVAKAKAETEASAKTAQEQAVADAVAAAVTAAKQRIADINALDEAKGREALASHFANSTDMTVEQVKAALAVAPKAAAAKPEAETPFDRAMNKDKPEVGAKPDGKNDEDDKDASKDVLALVHGHGLAGFGATKQK